MSILISEFYRDFREERRQCIMLSRKGDILKSELLGLEMEVPKVALKAPLFFIAKRIPAACNTVELGQSGEIKFPKSGAFYFMFIPASAFYLGYLCKSKFLKQYRIVSYRTISYRTASYLHAKL